MSKTKYLVYWNPYEEDIHFSRANFFLDLFLKKEDVVTIDLKNNKDPRSLYLLREADLVVVFLKQNEFCLNRYFVNDLVRNEHIIYVIVDFVFDTHSDWRRALERYRIPMDQLFVIPFDQRMFLLEEPSQVLRFIQKTKCSADGGSNLDFLSCYRKLREKIYCSLA